jgi:hypothetical protein
MKQWWWWWWQTKIKYRNKREEGLKGRARR